jgi:pyruvate dehydrogenase E2 component (dihydrolipoamide acetyltransferase)
MAELRMPSLGADMEAATLVEWKIAPGSAVRRGDLVAEVVTEKGDIEIESWLTGTVERLVVQPGEKVPVKAVLAIIRTEGEAEAKPEEKREERPAVSPAPARLRISPAARKRIESERLDATSIRGSGPNGTITLEDVERAVAAKPKDDPSLAMRRAIARAMSRAKREIPHYYLADTIDLTNALAWLERENASRELPRRLLPSVLLLKAVALAVREVPEMNGWYENETWTRSEAVHAGIATSLRSGGIVAPAIHDVAARSLDELMSALADLVTRVRGGGLRSSELSDPTITITSLGDRGCESVFPVIYPPQVAIVGFGTIVERPWIADGAVVARRVVHVSLAADHRVSDGHRGALFLRRIGELLQKPEAL